MMVTYVGMFFGLMLGLLMAGPAGGTIGLVVGMALGLLWNGVTDARGKVPEGAELVHEQQPILCVPKGSVADVGFVRDAHTGRWLDVERCTLCTPEDEVGCAKRCLLLIRDAAPRRMFEASAAAGPAT